MELEVLGEMSSLPVSPTRQQSPRRWLRAAASVVALVFVVIAVPWWNTRPTFTEKHRSEAATFCQENPETKFRKYPLASGADPAPQLDPFEWCVGAYIDHLP